MAIYLGGEKVKIILGNNIYIMNILSTSPTIEEIRLLSSEGYILKDLNGLYLIAEEDVNNE